MKNHSKNIFRSLRPMCATLLLGAVAMSVSAAVNSGDATLNRLEIKVAGYNIITNFDKSTKSYQAELDWDSPRIATFSAAPTASDAVVDLKVNGTTYTDHSLAELVEGENSVIYTVTSGSATETYTVTITVSPVLTAPIVTANPDGCEFYKSVTVELSVDPAGADIYYSTSGTATAASTPYTSPLTFTETTTLSTYAVNVVGDNTQSFTYTAAAGPDTDSHRVIYFKGGWSAIPYVYIYSAGEKAVEHAGKWPGTLMTATSDGWYYYQLPSEADTEAMVIFNTGATGSERYPADGASGIRLDFTGKDGWYMLADKQWYETNPEGPQKPSIYVLPATGVKVSGEQVISVRIADATTITGSFNGKSVSLSNGDNSILVSDYLTDGQSSSLSITATNDVGTTEFVQSFTRDDTTPVTSLTGDFRELSIYQVMVASFQHGEGGADGYSKMWGPEGHRKNGNLRGIIDALDYIKGLGMNALWMTPIFDSSNGGNGDERLQATGYFANDYFSIDPHFGTMEEFDELVAEAHKRDIYIILDGVFGHHSNCTGPSPNGNYIDNQTATNIRGTDSGNIAYPGSLEYFKEVVRYWMNRGVDGWRLDQCYQVYQGGHNYWYDLRCEVEAVAKERRDAGERWGTLGYMVGEDWTTAPNITVTRQDGLKSVMDFDGKGNLAGNVSSGLEDGVGSIGWFLASDATTRGYKDDGVIPTIFLSNHDTPRVGDRVKVETEPEKLMTRHAAVAAYSGPACTYYGDEIGDKSGELTGDCAADNCARTSGRIDIDKFTANERRVHDYVAKVFKARGENPALWRGDVERQQLDDVEVITKTDPQSGNKVICIFSEIDTTVSIGGTGIDLINGGEVSSTVDVKAWVPAFIKMN